MLIESAESRGGSRVTQEKMDPEQCRAHKINAQVVELLEVRWAMIAHPASKPKVLHELTGRDCRQILIRVAEHPEAHPDTLAQLASHPDADVRAAVAENVHAPFDVLTRLVNDVSPDVRYRLAENPHIPIAHLEALCEDENPYVSMRANQTIQRIESKNCIQLKMPRLVLTEEFIAVERHTAQRREAI